MAAGPFMVDIAGLEVSQEEKEILQHPSVSGVILFTRNFESYDQLAALVKSLIEIKQPRLLIAVDQEGGRVQRFRGEFSSLPALRQLGYFYEQNPQTALELSELCGWLMAAEMLSVGIDISFAPVMDIDREISDVIGSRAFSSNIDVLTLLSQKYIKGMHQAGMAATGKHFPGHGSVKADSHVALPIDERTYKSIFDEDMQPFRRLMPDKIDAIMVSHVIYTDKDKLPAGFSRTWVTDILKGELGFTGTVFSDDITMQAAASVGSHAERARMAIDAGCDCIIACNDDQGRAEIIEQCHAPVTDKLEQKFNKLFAKNHPDIKSVRKDSLWISANDKITQMLSEMA